jgi:beta-phosphoglucomutase-like phosphatase (HAD superfamily)
MAVVSNNSVAAVKTYLEIHNLRADVSLVSARASADVALLKPSPFLVAAAADALGVAPARCTLVGDSTTDMEASRVVAIGYANKSVKAGRLTAADVDAVVTSMRVVLAALVSDQVLLCVPGYEVNREDHVFASCMFGQCE